jgi:hypothetical protein
MVEDHGCHRQRRRRLFTADPDYWSSRVIVNVHLDSPGGLVIEAIDIGNTIGIFDSAPFADGARCTSACGLIWLAGARRYIGSETRVGFHTAYDLKTRKPSPGITPTVTGYLSMMGVSQPTIDLRCRRHRRKPRLHHDRCGRSRSKSPAPLPLF